jgi:hypothetical protein
VPVLGFLPATLTKAWSGSSLLSSSSSSTAATAADDLLQIAIRKPLLTIPSPYDDTNGNGQGGIISPRSIEQPSNKLLKISRKEACQLAAYFFYDNRIVKRWVEQYYPSGNKALGQKLVDRIYAAMGERLDEVGWLDAQTREAAKLKWQFIKANVAYDTDWYQYSDITGMLLIDISNLMSVKFARAALDLVDTPVNRGHFPAGIDVMTVNAFYYPAFNSINSMCIHQPLSL